uniref:Uncharacterized protein n=1 Tax=Sipha flava TaxID=143950 RepID=A0A2S2Q4K5_9HEMI
MGNKRKVLIAHDMIKEIQNETEDIMTKEMVLGNVKVRNAIVNLGNKFIQSIKEDCGSNVTLNIPNLKGDNTSIRTWPLAVSLFEQGTIVSREKTASPHLIQ